MSFSFGTPKPASGFTLPTTTAAGTTLQFSSGSGDNAVTTPQNKPGANLFGTPNSASGFSLGGTPAKTTASPATTLSFGTPSTSAPTGFSLGTPASGTLPHFNIPSSTLSTTTSAPSLPASSLSFGTPPSTTSAAALTSTTAATTSAPTLSFGFSSAAPTTTTSALTISSSTSAAPALPTATAVPQPPQGALTFAQLEDAINKWTIDLEDQGKIFANQAKELNAWDRILISNGEKILALNSGIERVKQQQQQLDHELDFVLSQQKELEDLIVPLEKELASVPIHDQDRNQIYHMAEDLDSQLKQMSEDLKEVIEHLNETSKTQDLQDPITQISKILNAHMNSLQWIDRNTTEVSNHLDEITKVQGMNRRNNTFPEI